MSATKKQSTQSKTLNMSAAIAQYAKAKDMTNLDKAGKAFRSRVRALRSDEQTRNAIEKDWPALRNRSKGDRYNEVPRVALERIVSGAYTQ